MTPRGPRRTSVLAVALAVSAFGPVARALEPPPTYYELHPSWYHKVVGQTRMHYVGLLQEAIRAVPKVPGYRCHADGKYVDKVGYGPTARLAVPLQMSTGMDCFRLGPDPRNRAPDVVIGVSLSMRPASFAKGGV